MCVCVCVKRVRRGEGERNIHVFQGTEIAIIVDGKIPLAFLSNFKS